MKFELLIRNATLIDGTRAPRFEADIGISSGRISRIGKLKEKGEVEIDASGKIAAPGFIDAHTHDDRLMLSAPDMAPKVSQGVTTVVTPWLTFGAMSGDDSIRRSSCVCASMKPGAATLPLASISFAALGKSLPTAAIFPPCTAISAW